jgi:peptide/nickel transport system permease protein
MSMDDRMAPRHVGTSVATGGDPAAVARIASVPRASGRRVWTQFRKNLAGRVALGVVAALFGLAVYAPLLALDVPFRLHDTRTGETTWPWLAALFDRNVFEGLVDVFYNVLLFALPALGLAVLGLRRLGVRAARTAAAGAAVIAAAFAALAASPHSAPPRDYAAEVRASGGRLVAVFPPVPHSFRRQHVERSIEPPLAGPAAAGAPHWLGTDRLGRDVFSRMLFGTRISLTIGLFAVAIYVAIGTCVGAMAGYFGGAVDILASRLIEIMMCFPAFFLILTLAAFIPDRSIFHVMAIIGVTSWPGVARLVRAEFLKQRTMDYVAAARGLGVPSWKIIARHILPNAISPVLVAATFGVAGAILTESGLSFLGLGDERSPSWGQMLTMGKETLRWWMIHVPGLAIFVTVSALNTVGDAFRDAIDPKMRL